MLKFTKFDLEPKWIDSSICFCGGGGSAEGPDDVETFGGPLAEGQSSVGNVSSSGSTMGGGFSEEQDSRAGTVFGVDGVSKTGSTAQDQTIGWSDGKGGKGANHDALSGATSEQMGVVDAVAAQSKAQGLSATDTQAAVANALSGYEKGSVDNSGGLTDKGKEAVNAAITGVGKDKASQDVEDSYGVPVGIGFSPSVSASNVLSSNIDRALETVSKSNVDRELDRLAASNRAAFAGLTPAEQQARSDLMARNMDLDTPRGITGLAVSDMTTAEMEQALADQFSAQQQAPAVGIATAPAVSASNVLGGPQTMPALGTPTNVGMTVQTEYGPMTVPEMNMSITNQRGLSGTNLAAVETALANPQARETTDLYSLDAPVSNVAPVSTRGLSSNVVDNFSMTPADQLEEVYGIDLDALNAAVDDPTAAMGARGPTATNVSAGIGYDPVTDMPYGVDFSGRNVTAPGAQFSTNLAGLTREQAQNQPFSMDLAQKIGSNPYGYEIDPVTGQVMGQIGTPPFGMVGGLTTLAQDLIMGPPQTTQDLIERGVYTGMTGQGDLGGGDGGEEVVKAPTDPCPEGFVMKDGACTPVEEVSDDAGGGSGNFVFQPPNAPPTFQPITQATPVGQINPFVLQPYTPMQAQNIGASRVAQGIQTLSPTGAALGRQI